jgi:hypothetical protein
MAVVSQLVKFGQMPLQLGLGARYWLDSPDNGPEGAGARGFSVRCCRRPAVKLCEGSDRPL